MRRPLLAHTFGIRRTCVLRSEEGTRWDQVDADTTQVIEEVDIRYHPNASDKLDEIGQQVAATLLEEPSKMYEPFLPKSHSSRTASAGAAGDGHEEGPGFVDYSMEEEMVHEAEWGQDKEEGIGEEKENDME